MIIFKLLQESIEILSNPAGPGIPGNPAGPGIPGNPAGPGQKKIDIVIENLIFCQFLLSKIVFGKVKDECNDCDQGAFGNELKEKLKSYTKDELINWVISALINKDALKG